MGKKPIVSLTYENERISIKKHLTLLKMCVASFLCGPRAEREKTIYIKTHKTARGPLRRDVTHIVSKVSCLLLKSFHFRRLEKR